MKIINTLYYVNVSVIIQMGLPDSKWSPNFLNESSTQKTTANNSEKIQIPFIREPKNNWKPHFKGKVYIM